MEGRFGLGRKFSGMKAGVLGLGRIGGDEFAVLLYELREDLNRYLAGLPGTPPVRSLADDCWATPGNSASSTR